MADYCDERSTEGHHCALPRCHPELLHYSGSPMLSEVEWVRWDLFGRIADEPWIHSGRDA